VARHIHTPSCQGVIVDRRRRTGNCLLTVMASSPVATLEDPVKITTSPMREVLRKILLRREPNSRKTKVILVSCALWPFVDLAIICQIMPGLASRLV
jgi:hypothetical protein